jgi:uncharacterized membrane protein
MVWPILFVPAASGQGALLNYSDAIVDISENSAYEKIVLTYVISESPGPSISDTIRVDGALENISVHDLKGALFASDNFQEGSTTIRYYLRSPYRPGARHYVTIQFTKPGRYTGENCTYTVNYQWGMIPQGYKIVVRFPPGASDVTTTENALTHMENNRLYMSWSGSLRNEFYARLGFSTVEAKAPTVEGENVAPHVEEHVREVLSPVGLAALLGAVVIAGIGVLMMLRARRLIRQAKQASGPTLPKEGAKKLLGILTASERKVMEELLKRGGLTQAELSVTEIPKPTMSRIVWRLENKGVVRRVDYGMSKKVVPADWVKQLKE